MTTTATVGDVLYMAHPEMDHGVRPMIVMAMTETQLMLMPMSHTRLFNGQQPIKGWHKENYFAANRVMVVDRDKAPAPAKRPNWNWKRIANDCWDCHEAYQARK